jgi:hypothetical protein
MAKPESTGTVRAIMGKMIAVPNSKVDRIGLARPPVVAVEPIRKILVIPLIKPADPPPAITANVH